MNEQDEGVVVLTAGQAAKRLEVSASGLRRLAAAYEAVYEPLPREPGTQARGYPAEAVERIRTARRGVELGQFKSTQAALRALKKGVAVDAGAEMPAADGAGALTASERQLEALVSEMQAMRVELERLRGVVEDRGPAELPSDAPGPAVGHGLIVRAALWLERFLRRSR